MRFEVIVTDNGDEYLDLPSTLHAAASYAEDHGFEWTGKSNLSEAIYLTGPGGKRLRIASHAGVRDEVIACALYPAERRIVDGEFETVIPLQPYAAREVIRLACAAYYDAINSIEGEA